MKQAHSITVARNPSSLKNREDDEAAIEWQVEFLYSRLPFKLYAYEAIELREPGLVHVAGAYSSRDDIRKTLRLYPRNEYALLYEDHNIRQVIKLSPEGKVSFPWKCTKNQPRELPLSFDLLHSQHFKRPFRDCMILPDGELAKSATRPVDCSRVRRSPPGATPWQILSNFKGSWKMYVNSPVATSGRGRIMYRIASEMASQGATADEIETVIRSSRAFQSKSSYPSEGREGQGPRWGEQEIQRLRSLAE